MPIKNRDTEGLWLVFDIGCLECYEESAVVGVFSSRAMAESLAKELSSKDYFSHSFQVFELEEVNHIHSEYQ